MRRAELRSGGHVGFTLVEMIAVLAIVVVIAVILIPVFAHTREKARQAACVSNLRQIGTATVLYAEDNEGRIFPDSYKVADGGTLSFEAYMKGGTRPGSTYDPTRGLLHPYLKTADVWNCPSASDLYPPGYPSSYGLNYWYLERPSNETPRRGGVHLNPVALAAAAIPAQTLLFGDSADIQFDAKTMPLSRTDRIYPPSRGGDEFHGRHNGYGDILWLDGHVTISVPTPLPNSRSGQSVAVQQQYHVGGLLRSPRTGNTSDDYYFELTKPQ